MYKMSNKFLISIMTDNFKSFNDEIDKYYINEKGELDRYKELDKNNKDEIDIDEELNKNNKNEINIDKELDKNNIGEMIDNKFSYKKSCRGYQ